MNRNGITPGVIPRRGESLQAIHQQFTLPVNDRHRNNMYLGPYASADRRPPVNSPQLYSENQNDKQANKTISGAGHCESNEFESVDPLTEERFWPTLGYIVFFSVLGVLARVGLNVLNTFPNEPVFPLIWSQIIGCFLYGMFQYLKTQISSVSFPLYIGLTTGLCGSITTFSSFMETTFRNLVGSPTYAILGVHVVAVNIIAAFSVIIITFGMAIVSIFFGATVAAALPTMSVPVYSGPKQSLYRIRNLTKLDYAAVFLGIASWIAALVVLVVCRNYAYFSGVNLAFSCVLIPFGSAARWKLAALNSKWKLFPVGTFAVNVVGTLVRGVCSMLLIRSDAGHMSPILLSAIVAIKDGFCGGLTTLSTMANELIKLPLLNSVIYAGASVSTSLLILGVVIFPFSSPPAVTPYLIAMPPVEMCTAFSATCEHFLYRIGCPYSQWTVTSCTTAGNLNTMNATCLCAALDVSTRSQESIFDMQLKPFIPGKLNTTVMQGVFASAVIAGAPMVPGQDVFAAKSFADPFTSRRRDAGKHAVRRAVGTTVTQPSVTKTGDSTAATATSSAGFVLSAIGSVPHVTIDICSSYTAACQQMLNLVKCPDNIRTVTGCTTAGDATTFAGACTCGNGTLGEEAATRMFFKLNLFADATTRVAELIIDSQVKGDIPFTKIHQPPQTVNGNWSVSICPSYQRTCDSLLQRLNCPPDQSKNVACDGTAQDTFVGMCMCGEFDAGVRVFEDIVDNDVKPQVRDFVWETSRFTLWKTVDFCPTYTSVCDEFMRRFGCPLNLQLNNGCTGSTPESFKGDCMCGTMDAGERVKELIFDSIVVPMISSIASPGVLFINQ
ncbi:hypothetical protein HDU83_003323 [Entophlyctis luteolus]|nr:hypothetical protein HDU83_003323 [Entophlyctis luteolus]